MTIAPSAQAHAPYVADAWGSNLSGQLGVGSEFGPEQCTAYQVPCSATALSVGRVGGVVDMAGGEEHSLAVLENGAVESWGNNELDQLGDGNWGSQQAESDVPTPVCARAETAPCRSFLGGVTSVAAGAWHNLALLGDGTVMAWGDNESGQLGDGFTGPLWNRRSPVPVKELSSVTAVAAGAEHSLALLSGGTVMSWGSNESGQLGDGKYAGRNVRIAVRGLSGVTAIAAGEEQSLALLSNGTVMAWGANDVGQLGNGTTTGPETCVFGSCSRAPVPVPGLSEVVAIAAGGEHSLALLKNGTVMAWGENCCGQLGDGTTTNSAVPVAVSGLSGVGAIAAGEAHSLALLQDGTVRAWGRNSEGELGNGIATGPELCGPASEPCSTTPVSVSGLSATNARGIAAGYWHSLAFGPPFPTVTAVSPSGGLPIGGTPVTITGTEFSGATAVKFGSADAIAYRVESPTSIVAVSPRGEGSVDITVTTPEGTSHTGAPDKFTYSTNPPISGPSSTTPTISPQSRAAAATPRSHNARLTARLTYRKERRHHKRRAAHG